MSVHQSDLLTEIDRPTDACQQEDFSVKEWSPIGTALTDLFDYQRSAIEKIEASTARRILFALPTGGGKTRIATELMQMNRERFKRSLFLSHRIEITRQTSDGINVPHGVIAAANPKKLRSQAMIQVAMVQTIAARAKSGRLTLPDADLVFIDEAHHTAAKTYREIAEAYPNAKIVGLTATPCRGDGRGLGNDFDELIEGPSVKALIELGRLVPARIFTTREPNLKGVRTQQGDYAAGQLEKRMNTDKLVGDIVAHWLKHGAGRKTVIFAVGVDHSMHIQREFEKIGVRAAHVDGTTPKEDREDILRKLAAGELDIVVNCMVLTEGWDCPEASCCVLARPTKQIGLYRQMVGRVLRATEGKTDAVIIDHSGAVHRHGRPEDDIEWTLDPDKPAINVTAREYESTGKDRWLECTQCGCMREGGLACTNCGFIPPKKVAEFQPLEGDLQEFTKADAAPKVSTQAKISFYLELKAIQQQRGYSPKWARPNFKEKFGHWPEQTWDQLPSLTPQRTTLAWVKSRQIAYAKAKAKESSSWR